MISRHVTIKNTEGLCAGPAAYFVQEAVKYKSLITLEKETEDVRANAKSYLGVLALGVRCGTTIKLSADGVDETEALDALCLMINQSFQNVGSR